MREVVKFNGKPEEVTLKYATGREGSNDHGEYFMYSLVDNRILFATPVLNGKIQDLRPRNGERLQIQLMPNKQWEVRRVDPPESQPRIAPFAGPRAVAMSPSQGPQQEDPNTKRELMTRLGDVLVNGIPEKVQYGIAFANFLILAADAVRVAERNSPAGSVRFDNRDVAAIATSMFIAADKAGYLTWNGASQGGR
jgi:hypothetical protein